MFFGKVLYYTVIFVVIFKHVLKNQIRLIWGIFLKFITFFLPLYLVTYWYLTVQYAIIRYFTKRKNGMCCHINCSRYSRQFSWKPYFPVWRQQGSHAQHQAFQRSFLSRALGDWGGKKATLALCFAFQTTYMWRNKCLSPVCKISVSSIKGKESWTK